MAFLTHIAGAEKPLFTRRLRQPVSPGVLRTWSENEVRQHLINP
jgi:hypothetical protein